MPQFELVSMSEATLSLAIGSSASTKRAEIIQEYGGYIEQLGPNKAGKLTPDEGESVATVRRRIGAAANGIGLGSELLQELHFSRSIRLAVTRPIYEFLGILAAR